MLAMLNVPEYYVGLHLVTSGARSENQEPTMFLCFRLVYVRKGKRAHRGLLERCWRSCERVRPDGRAFITHYASQRDPIRICLRYAQLVMAPRRVFLEANGTLFNRGGQKIS